MHLGAEVNIMDLSWLLCLKIDAVKPCLSIGDRTYIGHLAHIVCVRNVSIGTDVLVADRVYVSDNTHEYRDPRLPVKEQPVLFRGEAAIGNGSWVGEGVCIIGAKVGAHCVIGANSVVTRDIPDFSVAVGSPARVVKTLDRGNGTWMSVNHTTGEALA
jgi:acetyltransferase-like isoleucine patch superfamily enzyme